MIKPFSKKTDEEIYLEYVNDWLTVRAMADNYKRSYSWMYNKINKARVKYKNNYEKAI